ncbi:hypothetical protein [Dysgonomonas sp. 511]|uniref:hypothetical protein n=1 Tax=Dysgonomonas sp. 511 TaxID=2302930 RepID=UPI0013D8B6C1|nr:hypothetical protein [Dysgonomonas sp. 511]NDV79992.1 hypothetical protein [Dysgonomonas sp. 511]
MKNIYLLIIIIFTILLACESTKGISLKNRIFINIDTLKSESFEFVDDIQCVYTQEYRCDMNEKYRKVKIHCIYSIAKDKVLLKALSQPDFLVGVSCCIIPDSILKKCDFIFENTKESPFYISTPEGWNKANVYGSINNINGTDTLTYYKNKLFYSKLNECFEKGNIVLSNQTFFEDGLKINERMQKKQKTKKSFWSKRVLINNTKSHPSEVVTTK